MDGITYYGRVRHGRIQLCGPDGQVVLDFLESVTVGNGIALQMNLKACREAREDSMIASLGRIHLIQLENTAACKDAHTTID